MIVNKCFICVFCFLPTHLFKKWLKASGKGKDVFSETFSHRISNSFPTIILPRDGRKGHLREHVFPDRNSQNMKAT